MRSASNNQTPRRRLWSGLVLVLLALGSLGAGPPIMRSGHDHPLKLSPAQVDSLMAIRHGPSVAARAAILIDRPSNTVVWTQNADVALPMASTTKLMTVLVALESLSPDRILTVPREAIVGDASMGLKAGDQVSVRALVYGALLPSGNDAAMTLALATAGSEAAFVERMNAHAAEWGLDETHFVNPHGLDAPGHVSSAQDLTALAQRALQNPLIAEVVGTLQINIEGYFLTNTNQLLQSYDGAYGVKTGTTDAAGQVLIGAAARADGDALSVVLNSPDRFAETTSLLDFYFDYHAWLDTRLRRDALNRATAPDGTVYDLTTPARPLFVPSWQISQLRPVRLISFDNDGQPAGLFQIWLGEQKLLESPIQFTAQIE